MADLPDALKAALADRLAVAHPGSLRAAVVRLMAAYRSGTMAGGPVLSGPAEVAAYAAYRMPATYAAVRSALRAVSVAEPGCAPASLVDVGGGTGAAAWAAVDAFASLARISVLDEVDGALRLGRELVAGAPSDSLRTASWHRIRLPADVPAADLVTVSYVLGELTATVQREVVSAAAAAAGVLVVVEPGTPAGYARVIAARDQLLSLGHTVLAPCPHQAPCPLAGSDWCHFGSRVNRTALHRRIKDADLPYEDEKYAYVATAAPSRMAAGPPPGVGRVIRRPVQRKGMVLLRLCASTGTTVERTVTKRHGDLYRQARDIGWGDAFPE
jgi:ribosomal protein RSM22 (predicted rRNA methylase)